MSVAEFRVHFDNRAVDEEQLDRFCEIQVDLGIGMASEARLHLDVGVDETGVWSGIDEDYAQPFRRVRIEVNIRDGDFVPLIDGPIVGNRFELNASPNASKLILVVQDDSVLLNQEEEVEVHENRSPDEIAQQVFQRYGLTAETDSVPAPAGGLDRFHVQRGTAMQFLRELARQHGMFVYVEPGDSPGSSKGVFKRPDLSAGDYPELLLMGAERNINQFDCRFDGLRPLRAAAGNVDVTDLSTLTAESDRSDLDPQGDVPVHEVVTAGRTLLARTREDSTDLDAATAAAVNHSSWAYSANAQVNADLYAGVLLPYRVVTVAGAGGYLSGDWLIGRVTHTLNDSTYKQAFTLRRNARSAGVNGGGLLGDVF